MASTTAPRWAAAGPIAISSATSVTSESKIGEPEETPVVESDSDSQGATLSTLESSATAVAAEGPTVVTSTNTATLSFVSAAAGTAVFNTAWSATNLPAGLGGVAGTLEATYTFQVEGTGLVLNVGYGVELAGSTTFGLTNYSFSLTSQTTDSSFAVNNSTGTNPSVSGSQQYWLIDGETYTLTFLAFPNISGGIEGLSSGGVASFDFDIVAVPEPSSMVMAGFAMFGLAAYGIRSRRIS